MNTNFLANKNMQHDVDKWGGLVYDECNKPLRSWEVIALRDYLIAFRRKQNESQQDVADALGISRQYYAMIERGARQKRMDVTLISALATHFNVSAAEIVSLEQNIDRSESSA